MPKKLGTIQLDLDGDWVLFDYFGKKVVNSEHDPAFVSGIPRYLDLLDSFNIKATFFIVGQDLKIPSKRKLIQEIHIRGHEIANHSLNHRCGFGQLSKEEKRKEILESHQLIEETVGKSPVGFRAPGYDFDEEVLDTLEELGYQYDSSLLATYWGGLFRTLDRFVKRESISPTQYARFFYGRAPLTLYHPDRGAVWRKGERPLMELPMSTIPFFRLPFHGTFALKGGIGYFKLGFSLFERFGGTMNYIFHALEFADPAPQIHLPYTIANHLPWEKKGPFYRTILSCLTESYQIMPTRELIHSICHSAE